LWFFDQNLFNPALVSLENQHVFSANLRSQWAGFEGAPRNQSLNYLGQLSASGYFGAGVMNDQSGAFARRGFNVSYTQVVGISADVSLRAGLRIGLLQASFDEALMSVLDQGDPAVTGQKYAQVHPALMPGVALNAKGWVFGVSVPYAIENEFSISPVATSNNTWRRHLQGSIMKTLNVNETIQIQPSLWLASTRGAETQWAMNVNGIIKERFVIGGAYRNNSDLALVLGVNMKNLRFAYSYDLVSTDISVVASGSHELGFMYAISSKYADSDGDGVGDADDACPDQFGRLKGCPDGDNDGIADKDDLCPDEFGLEKFGGCPDSDGDGVPDKLDKCPDLAGNVAFEGCPDTDGDGVPDHLDSCPKTPATADSKDGCPVLTEEQKQVIQEAFGNLEFETGKAKIKESSFAFLMKLAMLLNANPTWKVDLAGHTDNVGEDASNMELSKSRVQAVVQFLVSLEVPEDRMIVAHYGESMPIDSNDTEAGRARNRRVEMKFVFE
jgi:type IX secretion system PorP/SprF family membrane protein